MILEVIGRTFNVVLATFLIKQQTELESSFCLCLAIEGAVRNVKHFTKVLNRHACVPVFAFALCQAFVGLSELVLIFALNAYFQETIQILDCTSHFILSLVDECNLLVAF